MKLDDILVAVDAGIKENQPTRERNRAEIAERVRWLQLLKDKAVKNNVSIYIEETVIPFQEPILRVDPEGDIFAQGKKVSPDCGCGDLEDLVGRNALLKKAFAQIEGLKKVFSFARCDNNVLDE